MICTECGDEFALQAELEAHMAEHQKDLQQHINDIAGKRLRCMHEQQDRILF